MPTGARISIMYKCLIAVALAAVTFPACAQRGGSRSASATHGGGFAATSSSAFHGSFSAPLRSGRMAVPQFSSSRYSLNQRFPLRVTSVASPSRRPDYDRGRYRRTHTPVYGLALPYGIGSISTGYFAYPDSAFYDNYYGAPPPQYDDHSAQFAAAPDEQAEAAPAPVYRAPYQPLQPLSSEPTPETPVTLVFKDGRPNQQIQNYMLTRTTLYVQEQRLREIPVDQLDLAAMNKINSDAGVEFQLPGNAR